jgi:hypothetical protein
MISSDTRIIAKINEKVTILMSFSLCVVDVIMKEVLK